MITLKAPQNLIRRFSTLIFAAALSATLVSCGGGSSSESGVTAETGGTGQASYDAASNFPAGSGLLWKPHSEIDGGLVVLVPAGMGGAAPVIRNANGTPFATGREHTDARGHNTFAGQIRYHWVFGKGQGKAFPKPSILSIGGANYKIPNPAGRYD